MPVDHESNPAGRLWMFAEHTRIYSPPDTPLREVWGDYLGVDLKSNDEKYLAAMTAIMALPEQIAQDVDALATPSLSRETLKKSLPHFSGVLLAHVGGYANVSSFSQSLDSGMMNSLEVASEILSQVVKRGALAPDVIERLRVRLSEVLSEATADPSLDPGLRSAIIEHVDRLLRLLDLYKVTGPEPLIDEVDRFRAQMRRTDTAASSPRIVTWLLRTGAAIVITLELLTAPITLINETFTLQENLSRVLEAPIKEDAPEVPPAPIEGGAPKVPPASEDVVLAEIEED